MSILSIPPELLFFIFAECDLNIRLRISATCKYFNILINDQHGWKLAFLIRFKGPPLYRMTMPITASTLSVGYDSINTANHIANHIARDSTNTTNYTASDPITNAIASSNTLRASSNEEDGATRIAREAATISRDGKPNGPQNNRTNKDGNQTNWRDEYLTRLRLTKTYSKSSFNQVTTPITLTRLVIHSTKLLSHSLEDGWISTLDPRTGKQSRERLYTHPAQTPELLSTVYFKDNKAWVGRMDGSIIMSTLSQTWQPWLSYPTQTSTRATIFEKIKDSTMVLAGLEDGTVQVWDWTIPVLLMTLVVQDGGSVVWLGYSREWVVAACRDRICIYPLAMIASSNGSKIFSDTSNSDVMKDRQIQQRIQGDFKDAWLDPHHLIVFTSTTLVIYPLIDITKSLAIARPTKTITSVFVYIPPSLPTLLALGFQDGSVELSTLSNRSLTVVKEFQDHTNTITALHFTPALFLSASIDGTIQVYIGQSLVRTLNKHRTLHIDDRWRIYELLYTSELIIAVQNDTITTFSVRPKRMKQQTLVKSRPVKIAYVRTGPDTRTTRHAFHNEVVATIHGLDVAKMERLRDLKMVEDVNGCEHGMSEGELVEYVRVLTAEDEEVAIAIALSLSEVEM